jgi:hypothetical protein
MAGRIQRSLAMVRASSAVLKRYPRLMILPLLSAVALVGAAAAMMVAFIVNAGSFQHAGELLHHFDFELNSHSLPALVGLAAVGWLLGGISLYFNAALVFCVLRCFAGQPPSIRDGLTACLARLPQIIGWAFVSSIIGGIISFVEGVLKDKLGFLGDVVGGLFNIGWAVVTYFVLPVLVVEGIGPVAAIKRSSALLRQSWGEAVVGSGGLGILSLVASVPALLLIAACVAMAIATGIGAVAAALFGVAIVYLLGMTVVFGTLGAIFRTGLYVYATTGQAPLDEALMKSAFQPKASK